VKEGAKVVIADLNEQAASAAASALGSNAHALKLDTTPHDFTVSFLDCLKDIFQGLW